MGITIDTSLLYESGYNKGFKDGIKGSIPKADYENRLKADMVAILDKVRNEIDKIHEREGSSFDCLNALDELKEFIDKLKAESVVEDGNDDN